MPWDLSGNSGTSTSSFLGTTDDRPLLIKTNGAEAMRVTSEGKLSIGSLGEPRSSDYKLDVQGTLNADEILKGGAPLVESQWTTVSGGITYEGGEVGIGTRISGYRLNVEGTINATDVHKGGTPLVSSQWEQGESGGISYGGGGNVGIGTINASYKLNVDGTINATEYRRNGSALVGSQWTEVSGGGGIRYNGLVGLGKAPASAYKLDVAGPINATDYRRDGRVLIAAGRTQPGLNWQQYENDAGVFIDVDTAGHHFTTTPVYVTALHGDSSHWATTGGSSVYNPTPTGFRVYIRWSDGGSLTVSQAQSLGWHIQWIGTETS